MPTKNGRVPHPKTGLFSTAPDTAWFITSFLVLVVFIGVLLTLVALGTDAVTAVKVIAACTATAAAAVQQAWRPGGIAAAAPSRTT